MGELAVVTTRSRSRVGLVVALVVVLGVLAGGGYLAWQAWGSIGPTRAEAVREVAALRNRWEAGDSALHPGEAAWIVRIPASGDAVEWPVRVGVGAPQLDGGLGWYPGSAQPGEVGNLAMAGRWFTDGEPLRGWFDLPVGGVIEVETESATFTYTIISAPASLTVGREDSWVLDPVPGRPGQQPTQALLTLTTHEDLVPTRDVSVAFAVLTGTEKK